MYKSATPQGPAHTCTATPSAPLMFISGVGSIIVCRSVVTQSTQITFMAVRRIESLAGALWTSVGGKSIKRLGVLKRHSPLNQMKPRQSSSLALPC